MLMLSHCNFFIAASVLSTISCDPQNIVVKTTCKQSVSDQKERAEKSIIKHYKQIIKIAIKLTATLKK